jgi:hypothetical protein
VNKQNDWWNMLSFDSDWIRVNEEFDVDGVRTIPVFARMVRMNNGMAVGRIVRTNNKFDAQLFRHGDFLSQGPPFDTMKEAFLSLEKIQAGSRL